MPNQLVSACVSTTAAISPVLVAVIGGQAKTTSLIVAEKFRKRHNTVLRAIKNLDCSPEFTQRNFALSEYTDSTGRNLPAFEMTRDGFTFLVTGFTGKEAAHWKEAYIDAFNRMEAELHRLSALVQAQELERIKLSALLQAKEVERFKLSTLVQAQEVKRIKLTNEDLTKAIRHAPIISPSHPSRPLHLPIRYTRGDKKQFLVKVINCF